MNRGFQNISQGIQSRPFVLSQVSSMELCTYLVHQRPDGQKCSFLVLKLFAPWLAKCSVLQAVEILPCSKPIPHVRTGTNLPCKKHVCPFPSMPSFRSWLSPTLIHKQQNASAWTFAALESLHSLHQMLYSCAGLSGTWQSECLWLLLCTLTQKADFASHSFHRQLSPDHHWHWSAFCPSECKEQTQRIKQDQDFKHAPFLSYNLIFKQVQSWSGPQLTTLPLCQCSCRTLTLTLRFPFRL